MVNLWWGDSSGLRFNYRMFYSSDSISINRKEI